MAVAVFDCDFQSSCSPAVAGSPATLALEGPVLGRCHCEVFPETPGRRKELHRRALVGETIQLDHEDRFDFADGSSSLGSEWGRAALDGGQRRRVFGLPLSAMGLPSVMTKTNCYWPAGPCSRLRAFASAGASSDPIRSVFPLCKAISIASKPETL